MTEEETKVAGEEVEATVEATEEEMAQGPNPEATPETE